MAFSTSLCRVYCRLGPSQLVHGVARNRSAVHVGLPSFVRGCNYSIVLLFFCGISGTISPRPSSSVAEVGATRHRCLFRRFWTG